jgi:predicted amino acid-binding ACT domain protein
MKSLAEIESQIKIKNTSDKSTKTWHELSMLLDLQKQLTDLREVKEKDRKQKLSVEQIQEELEPIYEGWYNFLKWYLE